MNRRGFISFLISAPITARLPWQSIANFIKPVAPSISAGIELTINEIIRETIRRNAPKLAANITANNALLRRLTNK